MHRINQSAQSQRFAPCGKNAKQAFIFKKHCTRFICIGLIIGLTACSSMTKRDKSTAIGAGIGAVTGAVLTGGSGIGTVGGAAVGGVIGHQVGKKK
jgi:osmotically inducible lipoprotein OsmB